MESIRTKCKKRHIANHTTKKTIAIHCKGGTGRTRLVAAFILNSAGYTKEEVYNRVQSIRPKALAIEL